MHSRPWHQGTREIFSGKVAASTKVLSTLNGLYGSLRVAALGAMLLLLAACGGGDGGSSSPIGIGGGSAGGAATDGGTGSVTLIWQPPAKNTDGSPLVDLAGYRIVYGTAPDRLDSYIDVNNPGVSSYVIENLTKTTWYFAVIAVNEAGALSEPSNTVSKLIS